MHAVKDKDHYNLKAHPQTLRDGRMTIHPTRIAAAQEKIIIIKLNLWAQESVHIIFINIKI